jgi:hypothetical protein
MGNSDGMTTDFKAGWDRATYVIDRFGMANSGLRFEEEFAKHLEAKPTEPITPDTIMTRIINNPGISYRELTENFTQEQYRQLSETMQELRWNKKLIVVTHVMWAYQADTIIRYYAAEAGDVTVYDALADIGTVLVYDPYETRKNSG